MTDSQAKEIVERLEEYRESFCAPTDWDAGADYGVRKAIEIIEEVMSNEVENKQLG